MVCVSDAVGPNEKFSLEVIIKASTSTAPMITDGKPTQEVNPVSAETKTQAAKGNPRCNDVPKANMSSAGNSLLGDPQNPFLSSSHDLGAGVEAEPQSMEMTESPKQPVSGDSVIAVDWWAEREAILKKGPYECKHGDATRWKKKGTLGGRCEKNFDADGRQVFRNTVRWRDSDGYCSWKTKACTCPAGKVCDLTVRIPGDLPKKFEYNGERNTWGIDIGGYDKPSRLFKAWTLKGSFRNFECTDERAASNLHSGYHSGYLACRNVVVEQPFLGHLKCAHTGDIAKDRDGDTPRSGKCGDRSNDGCGVCSAMRRQQDSQGRKQSIVATDLECTGFSCGNIDRIRIQNSVKCKGMYACLSIGVPASSEETQSTILATAKTVTCDGVFACINSCWQAEVSVSCKGIWACATDLTQARKTKVEANYRQVWDSKGGNWGNKVGKCRLHVAPTAKTFDFSGGASSLPAKIATKGLNCMQGRTRHATVSTLSSSNSWQSVPGRSGYLPNYGGPYLYGGVARSGVIKFDRDAAMLWKDGETTCFDDVGNKFNTADNPDVCEKYNIAGFQKKYPYLYAVKGMWFPCYFTKNNPGCNAKCMRGDIGEYRKNGGKFPSSELSKTPWFCLKDQTCAADHTVCPGASVCRANEVAAATESMLLPVAKAAHPWSQLPGFQEASVNVMINRDKSERDERGGPKLLAGSGTVSKAERDGPLLSLPEAVQPKCCQQLLAPATTGDGLVTSVQIKLCGGTSLVTLADIPKDAEGTNMSISLVGAVAQSDQAQQNLTLDASIGATTAEGSSAPFVEIYNGINYTSSYRCTKNSEPVYTVGTLCVLGGAIELPKGADGKDAVKLLNLPKECVPATGYNSFANVQRNDEQHWPAPTSAHFELSISSGSLFLKVSREQHRSGKTTVTLDGTVLMGGFYSQPDFVKAMTGFIEQEIQSPDLILTAGGLETRSCVIARPVKFVGNKTHGFEASLAINKSMRDRNGVLLCHPVTAIRMYGNVLDPKDMRITGVVVIQMEPHGLLRILSPDVAARRGEVIVDMRHQIFKPHAVFKGYDSCNPICFPSTKAKRYSCNKVCTPAQVLPCTGGAQEDLTAEQRGQGCTCTMAKRVTCAPPSEESSHTVCGQYKALISQSQVTAQCNETCSRQLCVF